jgi:DNA-binding transcriptional LysR family regulator
MADHGVAPRNAFICTEMGAVRALASKGLGVAVIPRSVAAEPGPPIELRPIAPEPLTWPVALVWARRPAPDRRGQGLPGRRARICAAPGRPGLRAA